MKLRELFSDPTKWTKGVYARDANGYKTPDISTDATCWCLVGGVNRCYWDTDRVGIFNRITEALPTGFDNIATFNDAEPTTFADVKALVDKLDI